MTICSITPQVERQLRLPDRTWAEMGKFVHLHDGAETMAGKRKGFQALIQRGSPNGDLAHRVMHREELASRQIGSELKRFMTDDGKRLSVVNLIKTSP